MKEKNYKKNKKIIIDYLNRENKFCFKPSIIIYSKFMGMTKNAVNQTLREMRKRKEIKYHRRRWGL